MFEGLNLFVASGVTGIRYSKLLPHAMVYRVGLMTGPGSRWCCCPRWGAVKPADRASSGYGVASASGLRLMRRELRLAGP